MRMWQQNLGDGKAASRKTAPTYGGYAGAVGGLTNEHDSIIPGRLANPVQPRVSSQTRRSHRSRSAIPVAREPPPQAWSRPAASAMFNASDGVHRASASRPLGSGRRQA